MAKTYLKFEKMWDEGERLALVEVRNCLIRAELPVEYLSSYPHYYGSVDKRNRKRIELWEDPECHRVLTMDHGYSVCTSIVETFIKSMRVAGERLNTINKTLPKKKQSEFAEYMI